MDVGGGEATKLEDGLDADNQDSPLRTSARAWINAGQHSPELEAGAAYPSGTTLILLWMSTMETDVMGMDWRTNQHRDRDDPSGVVGCQSSHSSDRRRLFHPLPAF